MRKLTRKEEELMKILGSLKKALSRILSSSTPIRSPTTTQFLRWCGFSRRRDS